MKAADDAQPFYGTWNCDGSEFIFDAKGYRMSAGQAPLAYESVELYTPGNYGLTFVDGYMIGLMDVSATSMTWSSPESGDILSCTR